MAAISSLLPRGFAESPDDSGMLRRASQDCRSSVPTLRWTSRRVSVGDECPSRVRIGWSSASLDARELRGRERFRTGGHATLGEQGSAEGTLGGRRPGTVSCQRAHLRTIRIWRPGANGPSTLPAPHIWIRSVATVDDHQGDSSTQTPESCSRTERS